MSTDKMQCYEIRRIIFTFRRFWINSHLFVWIIAETLTSFSWIHWRATIRPSATGRFSMCCVWKEAWALCSRTSCTISQPGTLCIRALCHSSLSVWSMPEGQRQAGYILDRPFHYPAHNTYAWKERLVPERNSRQSQFLFAFLFQQVFPEDDRNVSFTVQKRPVII